MGLFVDRPKTPTLQRGDAPFIGVVQSAYLLDPAPAAMWAVYMLLAAIAVAVAWAGFSQVDIVAKANGHADVLCGAVATRDGEGRAAMALESQVLTNCPWAPH